MYEKTNDNERHCILTETSSSLLEADVLQNNSCMQTVSSKLQDETWTWLDRYSCGLCEISLTLGFVLLSTSLLDQAFLLHIQRFYFDLDRDDCRQAEMLIQQNAGNFQLQPEQSHWRRVVDFRRCRLANLHQRRRQMRVFSTLPSLAAVVTTHFWNFCRRCELFCGAGAFDKAELVEAISVSSRSVFSIISIDAALLLATAADGSYSCTRQYR